MNHGTDGDLSDGISVISDCESINDRHSPMPIKMTSQKVDSDDTETEKNESSGVEDINSYTLVERSNENVVEIIRADNDFYRNHVWNPSNIIVFGLIVGAAAILSSQCWKINLSHQSIVPEMSLLAQRIQDLEIENLALKIEVNRLVELHHAGHDHSHPHEKVVEKRPVKQKKVWTGADETPIHIPKEPIKENYCSDEYLNSDDLFASYNSKKCEDIDDSKKQKYQTSKIGSGDDRKMASDNSSQQFESGRKKNFNKDEASIKREKFAESKLKNKENQNVGSDIDKNMRDEKYAKIQEERQKIFDEATQKYLAKQKKMEKKHEKDNKYRQDDKLTDAKYKNDENAESDTNKNIRNEKYMKIQEERQKIFDEATEKYLEKQKKMEKQQEKDGKHRDSVLRESNGHEQSKGSDSEWYDKMMKQREKLRAVRTKQQTKENWYVERAHGREKVREKHDKQMKSKKFSQSILSRKIICRYFKHFLARLTDHTS